MSRQAELDAMLAEAWAETAGQPPLAMADAAGEDRPVTVHSLGEMQSSIGQATGLDAEQLKAAVGLGSDGTAAASHSPCGGSRDLADSPEVRLWAVADGWEVPQLGRLPGAIVLAYQAAKRGVS